MTIPFICVALAALLVLAAKVPVAVAMRQDGGYDNHHPRAQQARLQGWGKRAVAAHYNAIEAFPWFAAGVLIAHVGGGNPDHAAALSITFVVGRVLYNAAYIANVALLRSVVWTISWTCSIALMFLPAFQ